MGLIRRGGKAPYVPAHLWCLLFLFREVLLPDRQRGLVGIGGESRWTTTSKPVGCIAVQLPLSPAPPLFILKKGNYSKYSELLNSLAQLLRKKISEPDTKNLNFVLTFEIF